ncbi:MAG TPA: hypothetical protein DEA71_17000 [Nitrospira sp.]|nr:hypothetical protein [Nitrospira sp.]
MASSGEIMPGGVRDREGDSRAYGVREHLRVLFRHRRRIQIILLTAMLVAGPGSFLISGIYSAEVRLLIQSSRAPFTISTPLTGQVYAPADISQKDEVATEVQIFTSRILLDKLVERFGVERVLDGMHGRWDWVKELPLNLVAKILGLKPESPQFQAVEKLRASLNVEGVRQTEVFVATLESPHPEFAAEALNALVDIYLDYQLVVRKGKGAHEFFDEQTERMRTELTEAELRLQSFKDKWNIVSIEDQKRHLLQQLTEKEAALRETEVSVAELDVRIAKLRERLAGQQEAIPLTNVSERNPMVDQLKNRLMEMELEYSQYVPHSPAASELVREIAEVRARLQAENVKVSGAATSGINQTYQDLERHLLAEEGRRESLRPRLSELNKHFRSYRDSLNTLDQREMAFHGLTREVKIKQEALDLYLKKKEESRVNEVLDQKGISNVTAVEHATVPEKPIRPRKFLNLLLGLLVGVIGGVGSAYVSEFFRRSFTTREETVNGLKRDVLAALPLSRPETSDAEIVAVELRHAAQRILRHYHQRGLRTILVTSSLSGEGRSYVAAKIAGALSDLKFHVLLMTAGDLTTLMVTQAGAGRVPPTLNQDIEEVPESTDRSHLSRLNVRYVGGTALDFAERLTEVTKTMRDRFDLVVLDAPSLSLFPEMRVVIASVDGILLVVEAERTTGIAASRTLEMIDDAGGQMLGVVLNKCRYVIPDWFYDRWLRQQERNDRG